MIAWLHDDNTPFPPTERALGPHSDAPGLIAAGGSLAVERLTAAYSRGIFPWYGDSQPVLWWSPDPRMVLRTADFRVSHSLRRRLRQFIADRGCALRIDTAFARVIESCANAPRAGQPGTWIVGPMRAAYRAWHRAGAVHSFETWIDGELAGGLYGVSLGRMFFGESMFARRTDASKIALAGLVAFCRANGIDAIDCQQNTAHLASLGAREWPRAEFEAHLARRVHQAPPTDWTYHASLWGQLGLDGSTAPATHADS